jgi:hypothetical protein
MSRKVQVPVAQIIKILMMITALVAVVGLRGPCAEGVRNMFNAFAPPPGTLLPDGGIVPYPPDAASPATGGGG